MQTRNPILDDLARVAGGAMGTLAGVKTEIETLIRQRLDSMLAGMDLVPREEFDAVKAMAATARAEQETLAARVATLEAELARRADTIDVAAKTSAAETPPPAGDA